MAPQRIHHPSPLFNMTADPCPLGSTWELSFWIFPGCPPSVVAQPYLGPWAASFSASAAPGFLLAWPYNGADFVVNHLTFCLRAREKEKAMELRDI